MVFVEREERKCGVNMKKGKRKNVKNGRKSKTENNRKK
jgi:hypothetical protein